MSWRRAGALSLLPGLGLAAVALVGWVPTARDVPSYFVPLRHHLARVFRGEASPWINLQAGCGEPFFANPQSGLLYPLAWGALVLPAERAVGLEVGLHLAILALGVVRLVRALGGAPAGALAGAWGATLSGPVLSASGMLNNLETAAWLPWVWEAALLGRTGVLALTVAASFLAAEPVLALVGAVGAVLLVPRWRTSAGVFVGLSLCAVQALPMAFWIAGGDRGPEKPLEAVSLGGVSLGELPALVFPGFPLPKAEMRFLLLISLPLWVVLALVAVGKESGRRVRLALVAAGCAFLAILPTLPWGDALWAGLSFGLVRLPGRFLIITALAVSALAGAATLPRSRFWVAAALGSGAVGAVLSQQPLAVAAQAVAAALAPWGMGWASAGSLLLAATTVPVLELRRWRPEPVLCAEAQAFGRLYPVPVDAAQLRWVSEGGPSREASLAWGYAVLLDARSSVRSFGPLVNRILTEHLHQADRGPSQGWWVAALGARRMVALKPVAGYPVVCQEGELAVLHNPGAFPLWALWRRLPSPGERPEPAGEVTVLPAGTSSWRLAVRAREAGVLLWLFAPDRGWCFRVDGVGVEPVRGPGILQGVPLPAGTHEVQVTYRPPGWGLALAVSLVSLAVVGVLWRR